MRIDEIGFGDLKLIQNPEAFCYGIDAVLLADFATVSGKSFSRAIDLGSGNGIIPLILSYKNQDARITGVELVEDNAKMAMESVKLNNLQERIDFINGDVVNIKELLQGESTSVVTCNPPYFKRGGGIVNNNSAKFIARQETTALVEDFIKAAAYLLENRGEFYMIHRPDRLVDIIYCCRKYRLEPKELRFVSPMQGEVPNMVLVHCVKGGGKELRVWDNLNVYNQDRTYTDEVLRIYERK